jgi:cell division protein FtsN
MAATRRKRRRRGGSGALRLAMIVVLVAGVAGGGAWWWRNRAPGPAATASEPAPAPAKPARRTTPTQPAVPTEDPELFSFYDTLPDQTVEVPPAGSDAGTSIPPPSRGPGLYVVQAGAFPDFAQADNVKARLAMLGIVAQIQKITVDERSFHRVRIGPIDDPARLARLREQLRANRIDHVVVQVTE